MNTITPIIIPVTTPPAKCPKCGKPEDIREVCGHCGYEYPEGDPPRWWEVVLMILTIVFALVFICAVIIWAMDYSDEQSLVQFLWAGIKWFFGLFGKIF